MADSSVEPQAPRTPAEMAAALLGEIKTAKTSEEVDAAAQNLAKIVESNGIITLKHEKILETLESAAKNKKSGYEREGAMIGFSALGNVLKQKSVPILLNYLELILDLYAGKDKDEVVQGAAKRAAETIVDLVPPEATKALLAILYKSLGHNDMSLGPGSTSKKWQTKIGALRLLSRFAKRASDQIGEELPDIIPPVSNCMADTKQVVADEAVKTMRAICKLGSNADIEPHLNELVRCMSDPQEVPKCIEKLASTTFVAEVNGPTLAIMVPLLRRALNEKSTLLLRQTIVITDNVCKLVRDPRTAAQFLPQLYPGIEHQANGAAFPEIREIAAHAKKTLDDAGGHQETSDASDTLVYSVSVNDASTAVKKEIQKAQFVDSFFNPIITFIGTMVADLIRQEAFGKETWSEKLEIYLKSFLIEKDADSVCKALHEHFEKEWRTRVGGADDSAFDQQEGEELCCVEDFSLAYGTRLLLNHTKLKLHRGQRYGLCGANGAGKTTLMRAIHGGKVEGFPSQDEVRTAFVDYTVQGADTSLSIVDYIAEDKNMAHVSRADIEQSLLTVGFDETRLKATVDSLSGGWKMKVELARAMLTKADILLLDEPTNHLDTTNIKWLEDYLNSQSHVTCLIVSHDSSFLDNVCTQILHYEKRKLRLYHGNLSKFVEVYPAARSYYNLEASTVKFTFPKPTILQGVRSNTKVILKMTNCTFTYDGASQPSLHDVSAALCLSSRVAVIGPNGAGKSTIIKLLTGESVPQTGEVWRHPALRIGYVAQHAFHHIEQHLEKSPMEYLRWRYESGEDKEVREKATRKWTDDEITQMNKYISVDGEERQIECLLGRAKLKKTFQYEIKWKNLRHKFNSKFSREKLLELGFQKLVQEFDDKEASREGLTYRKLEVPDIRQHFKDVGLDPDIAQYGKLGQLSGGQKVKVVIAAAMWNNSHMLVLDEPTNFLDREALGGLATAIKDWAGAVVMISHSQEFVSALCPETWKVEAGRLQKTGDSAVEDEKKIDETAVSDRISKKKKKTRNELKLQAERRRQRHVKWLIEGGEKEPDTDSD